MVAYVDRKIGACTYVRAGGREYLVTAWWSHEGKMGQGTVLRDCSLSRIGGRRFLLGTYQRTGRGEQWLDDVQTAIAWDEIHSPAIMTPAQHDRALKLR